MDVLIKIAYLFTEDLFAEDEPLIEESDERVIGTVHIIWNVPASIQKYQHLESKCNISQV